VPWPVNSLRDAGHRLRDKVLRWQERGVGENRQVLTFPPLRQSPMLPRRRQLQIGALPATPGCARRRATGRARLAGPAPARHRARGELLPALSGPFDAAAPGGDDDRSGPQAADRGCVVRNGFLLNTADTTCGDPDTNAAQPGGDAAIVRRARRASERT
jgi:hypothetical protein